MGSLQDFAAFDFNVFAFFCLEAVPSPIFDYYHIVDGVLEKNIRNLIQSLLSIQKNLLLYLETSIHIKVSVSPVPNNRHHNL